MTTWTAFDSPNARCDACQAFDKGSKIYRLPGEGHPEAAIALVGEGAGWQEERDARNFVGRAGELLDGCITEAGLLRSELWIANSMRCRLTHAATGKDRKPTMHELDCCRDFSIDELRRVKPRVIVALGDVASAMLLSRRFGGIQQQRGTVTWSDEWNAWVVQTLHPAYALRVYPQRHFIIEDLKTAKRIAEEGAPRERSVTEIEVVSDIDRLREIKHEVIDSGKFHWDWESKGIHLTKSYGFCVSFATREGHAYVVPRYGQNWSTWWGRDKYLREVDDELREIFLSDCIKGGFHVAFDMTITQTTLGVVPTNVTFCGMIAHHAINNHLGRGSNQLKVCCALYTPMGRYDDELDAWLTVNGYTIDGKPNHDFIWKAPNQIVHRYNGMDSDGSLRLEYIFIPQLHSEGLWKIYREDLFPTALAQREDDRLGLRINIPHFEAISAQLGDGITQLDAQIAEMAGHPVNAASSDQVAHLLFEEQGLPILERTDTGKPSTKEEVLKQFEDANEYVPLILQRRAFAKVKGTWIDGTKSEKGQKKALRAVLDEDGYARMNTLVHGTETFRFVTTKPFAVHTFPKTVKGMPSVRALIIPDDNYRFIEADYVQQEYVIQAILAGQWDMVEACLDRGEDVHALIMQELFHRSITEFLLEHPASGEGYDFDGHVWRNKDAYNDYKGVRQTAKNTNFCIMFRGQAKKLARMAFNCTGDQKRQVVCKNTGTIVCDCESKAAEYIQAYNERYEKIRWWQYHVIKTGYETGRSTDPFGTYRKLPAFYAVDNFTRWEAERQACNAPIQISGAHVMRRARLKIRERFLKEKFPGRIVFSVHDQLNAQVRHDLMPEGKYIMSRYMEAAYPELAGRSLRVDYAETDCWGG